MSSDQIWSLSDYRPARGTHDTFIPLRAVPNYDDRVEVLEDERIPSSYGSDLTGWYVLREILDDLRNERVLI